MLDIYFVEKMPKPKMIPVLLKLLKARHEGSIYVKRYSEKKITVDSEELCTFNVDGESMCSKHFEIELKPNALKVFNDRNFIEEII